MKTRSPRKPKQTARTGRPPRASGGGSGRVTPPWDPSQPIPGYNGRYEAIALDQYQNPAKAMRASCRDAGYKAGGLNNAVTRIGNNSTFRARLAWLQSQEVERIQRERIASKQELAEGYTAMWRTTMADFLSVDQDGELFVQVTKDSMAALALKKFKGRRITDEHGNTVMGVHLQELELVDRVAAGKALSALMAYDPATKQEHGISEDTKAFLDRVMNLGLSLDDD